MVCHQRKIKCDLDYKSPGESCSNCQELSATCDLYIRKPRIKKFQIQQNLKLLLSKSNYKSMNGIHVDPMAVLSRHVLKNKYYKLNTGFNVGVNALKFSKNTMELLQPFLDEEEDRRFDLALLNQQDLDYLSDIGCFSLPSIGLCQVYINDFFELVHKKLPFIDKDKFFNEHTDLTNPPSLLLIQSILCIAAKVNDKPFTESKERETQLEIAGLLYKRSKLLLDYGLEKDPLKIIQALSFISLVNFNDDSCAFWQYFQSIEYYSLSPSDLSLYKKMYWYWKTKFSFHTFVATSQIKKFEIKTFINVPKLSLDDFRMDTFLTDLQKVSILTNFQLSETLNKLNEISVKADILASNNQPFDHLTKQLDYIFHQWYSSVDPRLIYKVNDKSTQNGASAITAGIAYLMLLNIHSRNMSRCCLMSSFGEESRAKEMKYIPSQGILILSTLMSYSIFSRFKLNKLLFPTSIDFETSFFVNTSKITAVFLECDDALNSSWNYLSILKELSIGIQNISTEFYRVTLHDKSRREKMNLVTSVLQDAKFRKIFIKSILKGSDKLTCTADQFNFTYDDIEVPDSFKASDIVQMNGIGESKQQQETQKQQPQQPAEKMSITSLVSNPDVLMENHLVANFDDLVNKIDTN